MALRFRIGSIPVEVQLFFFLTALLLGGGMDRNIDPATGAALVGIVFVSILLHELGHALVGRMYGLTPKITLHGMGGLTSWTESSRKGRLGHGAHILISVAGPMVGLVVGGVLYAVTTYVAPPTTPMAERLVMSALFINIGWSIFNLLPILPLDGGQIMSHALAKVTRDRLPRVPHYVSIAVAVAVGLAALYVRWIWVVMLAALYVHQNVRALRAVHSAEDETPRFDELSAGFRAIEAGNGFEAIRIAESLLAQTRLPEIRLGALRLLAYGRLLEGQWGTLMQLLEAARFEIGPKELQRFEQAAVELERPDEAAQIRSWLGDAPPSAPASPFRA